MSRGSEDAPSSNLPGSGQADVGEGPTPAGLRLDPQVASLPRSSPLSEPPHFHGPPVYPLPQILPSSTPSPSPAHRFSHLPSNPPHRPAPPTRPLPPSRCPGPPHPHTIAPRPLPALPALSSGPPSPEPSVRWSRGSSRASTTSVPSPSVCVVGPWPPTHSRSPTNALTPLPRSVTDV